MNTWWNVDKLDVTCDYIVFDDINFDTFVNWQAFFGASIGYFHHYLLLILLKVLSKSLRSPTNIGARRPSKTGVSPPSGSATRILGWISPSGRSTGSTPTPWSFTYTTRCIP